MLAAQAIALKTTTNDALFRRRKNRGKSRTYRVKSRTREDEKSKKWGFLDYLTFIGSVLAELPVVEKIGEIIKAVAAGNLAFACKTEVLTGEYFSDFTSHSVTDIAAVKANSEETKKWVEDKVKELGDTLSDAVVDKVTEQPKDNKTEAADIKDALTNSQTLLAGNDSAIGKQGETSLADRCKNINTYIADVKNIDTCLGVFNTHVTVDLPNLKTLSTTGYYPFIATLDSKCKVGKKEMKMCWKEHAEQDLEIFRWKNRKVVEKVVKDDGVSTCKFTFTYVTGTDQKTQTEYNAKLHDILKKNGEHCAQGMIAKYNAIKAGFPDIPKKEDCTKLANAKADGGASTGFKYAAKVGIYLVKQMALCGLNFALSLLWGVFKATATAVISQILNWLTVGVFTAIKVAWYVGKLIYNIYKGYNATESKEQAERWGASLGIGIRLLLIAVGVARRKRLAKMAKIKMRMWKKKRMMKRK